MSDQHPTSLDQQALQRLQQISTEILGQLDLDSLLASIMTGAANLFDASQINLYRYVPDRDALVTWIPLRAPEGVSWHEHPRGDGMAGTVLQTRRGLRLDDYDGWEGRSSVWPTGVTGPSLAVPMRRGDEWLGVITAARPHGAPLFTDEDLALLQLFANQAAVAIANAQLYAGARRRAEELSKLYDTSLDVVSQLDLPQVLEAALGRATELLDSQSANLRLYDAESGLLVPLLPFHQLETIAQYAMRPGEGLSGKVFSSGQTAFVNNYDAWEGRSGQYPPGVVRRAMAAPLREGDRIMGVLVIERSADFPPFDDDNVRLLSLFANQVSVAITNSNQVEQLRRLYAQQLEKERLDQQVHTARAFQTSLLPPHAPEVPGWDIAALWRPALELGGDFYDWLPLSDDVWGFVMADVTDKGIPAALLMAVARSLFRVYATDRLGPAETLTRLNRDLVASSNSGMFVSAVYAMLDTRSGAARLSAAGHPPALLVRHSTRRVLTLNAGGMPLGILPEAEFAEVEAHLESHDALLLYTDGVTEASRADGDLFGPQRLRDCLLQSRTASAKDRIAELDSAVHKFIDGEGQSDDVAYLVLRREA